MLFGKFWTVASATSFNLSLFFGFCTKSSTDSMLFFHWEGLVYAIRYSCFFFQTTPARIVEELQEVAVFIGHLSWDADWVAVEVVGLLAAFPVFVGPVVYLFQGFARTEHTLRRDWRIHAGYGLLIQSSSICWSFLLLLSLRISIFFLCANNKSKILDISFESENFLGFFMYTKLLISKLCK